LKAIERSLTQRPTQRPTGLGARIRKLGLLVTPEEAWTPDGAAFGSFVLPL